MLMGVFPRKADLEALQRGMPGALRDPWSLMPEKSAHAISSAPLEHDHEAHLSGSFVLHHPLIAGRTIAWPERGLAGVRAQSAEHWRLAASELADRRRDLLHSRQAHAQIGQLPHVAVAAITRTA